jgi:LysM repeat protein
MAEYNDFLYYKDKQISNLDSKPESMAPQHAPIHITLPPLKRPQIPPSATSPPFSFQSTNFYAQHIHELASSPPSKTHLGAIELQSVVDHAKEPAIKSDPKEALKRCQNCGQYYKVKDNVLDKSGSAPCRYHPGKYQTPISSQHMGAFPMWSCCKNDEHSPGCRVQHHVEDVEATQTLRVYDELRRTLGQVTDEQSTGQEEALIDFTGLGPVPGVTRTIKHGTPSKPGSDTSSDAPSDTTRRSRAPVRVSSTQVIGTELIHYVKTSDTLYGLALKYDVTVADIKAANKMTSDNIFAYSQLVIPRTTAEVEVAEEVSQEDVACRQAQMVNKFKRTQRVANEEALYYLDICEWNYEEAVKEREEDLKFETVTGGHQAQKVK